MTENADPGERLFRVTFDLPDEDSSWVPFATERLWAAKTPTRQHLRVQNIPFYIRGISHGDIILAHPDHDRREIVFDELVEESGHSTVQLLFRTAEGKLRAERLLVEAGCWWESLNDSYIAVDIAPAINYSNLRPRLLVMKEEGLIGIQESAISTLHQGQFTTFP